MSDCTDLAPLIAARPLGALEPEEEARVAEHLVLCQECPAVAERLARALEAAVPPARRAPEAAWDKLRERIERDQARPEVAEPRVVVACSFCHGALAKPDAAYCASCLAPHHADCFAEHGRCSAPGCGETQTVAPRTLEPARPRRRGERVGIALAALAGSLGIAALAAYTSARATTLMKRPPPQGGESAPAPAAPLLPPPPPATPRAPIVVHEFWTRAPLASAFAWDELHEALLAVARDGELYHVNLTGERLPGREHTIGEFGDPFSEPAVLDGRAYVGTTGAVLELDLMSRWVVQRRLVVPAGSVVGKPLVTRALGGRVVVGTSAGDIVCFGPSSEQPLWRVAVDGPVLLDGVALDDRGLQVAFVAADGRLHAFATATGEEVRAPFDAGDVVASPVRRGDRVFVATSSELVVLSRLDDGTAWRKRGLAVGGPFSFVASADGSRFVIAGADGKVAAYATSTFAPLWSVQRWEPAPRPPQLAWLPEAGRPEGVVALGPDGRAYVSTFDSALAHELELGSGRLSAAPGRVLVADARGFVRLYPRP